jgi:hypothetical protein
MVIGFYINPLWNNRTLVPGEVYPLLHRHPRYHAILIIQAIDKSRIANARHHAGSTLASGQVPY